MARTASEITTLVRSALADFSDERRRAFEAILCEPSSETSTWDWHDNRDIDVWIVARSSERGIVFAYADDGYGDKWGVLYAQDGSSLGMDAQWYLHLEDAFISSGAWHGPKPIGFAIR